MASNILYWDILSQSRISSTGAVLNNKPFLALEDLASWDLRIKSNTAGTISAVDLSSCVSFSGTVDVDFKHEVIAGALTAGFTGAITALTIDGVATTPPLAGVIILENGAGEVDSVAYSSWTLNTGVYTFVVDATLDHTYLNNDIAEIENTSPCVRILNTDIDSTNKGTGILICSIDCDSEPFANAVGELEYVAGYFDISGFNVSGRRIFYARFPIDLKNILDPAGGIHAAPSRKIPTWVELTALLTAVQPKESYSSDISFKTAQDNIIFVVPTGKLFRPLRTEIITTSITGPATLPTFTFKAGSTALFTARVSENTGVLYGVDSDELGGSTYYPAGTIFYCSITSGGTSTTHTGKALIKGDMIDA